MLQKLKKSTALIMCILMCISMLTCIVLPTAAASPAEGTTDPYAATNAHTSVATVSDGKITVNGTDVTVPAEFADEDIYIPDARMYFYDPEWNATELGIDGNEGDIFFAKYGDGTTWGNGKVYALTWRVNAFGDTQYDDVTDLDGTTVLKKAGSYDGWADLTEILRHKTPTVGGDNNYYVMLAPGLMKYDTAFTDAKSDSTTNTVTYATADLTTEAATTAKKTELAALEQSDYTNVYFYGPQAGKNPTAGEVGNTTICNNRSVNTSREIVFANEFHLPMNAVYHMDGVAMNATDSDIEARIYMPNYTGTESVSGLYMTNFYSQIDCNNSRWVQLGTSSKKSKIAVIFHLTDSYFKGTTTNKTTSVNYLAANDLLFDNVVSNMTVYSGRLRFTPQVYMDTAFLGDYRNKAHYEIINSTFDGQYSAAATASTGYSMFSVYAADYGSYDSADIVMKGNYFGGYKEYWMETTGKCTIALTAENNTFKAHKDSQYARTVWTRGNGYDGQWTFKNNTFIADPASGSGQYDFYSASNHKSTTYYDYNGASGNLFVDYDGNVRPVSTNTKKVTVDSDIYISNEFSDGVSELFTVKKTAQELPLLGSNIDLTTTAAQKHFNGTVYVNPKEGVTYTTDGLFVYDNEKVELLGFYSDAACTAGNEVTELTSEFTTVYAKAQYKTANNTATVIYTVINSDYAPVWEDYGLAPTTETDKSNGYVDLTTQEAYAGRDGGNEYWVAVMAEDWLDFAHKTLEGALKDSTEDMFTSVATTGDDNTEDDAGDNVVLDSKDIFYAKMPTTGIVYKLAYAVTACQAKYTNMHLFGTLMFFPGTYTKSAYHFGGVAFYTGQSKTNLSVGFNTEPEKNYNNANHLDGCKEFRILGAQAGVSAADVENGKLSSKRDVNESIVKGMNVYFLRNGSLGDGATNVIDGISFTDDSRLTTAAGSGASDIYSKTNIITFKVNNCFFDTLNWRTLYLYQNQKDAMANLQVYFNNTYMSVKLIAQDGEYASDIGRTVASGFHISDCVIDTSEETHMSYIFRIAPVAAEHNSETIRRLSYTCKNSYLNIGDASLFAIKADMTSGLSSANRAGIELDIKDNVVADANTLIEIIPNKTADENKNMAAITDITLTGNKVTGSGDLLIGYGSDYAMRKVNVANNSFKGFATDTAPAFTGFTDAADFTKNLYMNADGNVISANVTTGKVTNIVVSEDYTALATDFKITAGATELTQFTWKNPGTNAWTDLSANARVRVPYTENMTAKDLKDSLTFASDKVSVVKLEKADGTELADTDVIAAGDVLSMSLQHSSNTAADAVVVYTVKLPCLHTAKTEDTAEGSYLAPTCGTDGYQWYICDDTDCKERVQEPIPATTEHDYELDTDDSRYVASTCTTHGTDVYVCQNEKCMADGTKASYTKQAELVAHTKGESLEIYKDANCKTEGIKAYKCKWFDECGKWMIPTDAMDAYIDGTNKDALKDYTEGTDYEIIAKGTHNFELVADHEDTVAATCTSKGVAIYICSGCSDKIEIETDMISHNYKAVVTTPATCAADGVMTYTCTECSDTYTEKIPGGDGHDYEATVTIPATCSAKGEMTYSCKNCTDSYTEPIDEDPNNHAWDDGVVQKAATCVATGEMLYTCGDCTTTKVETIPINSEAHKYEANVTKEPTCTEDGEMTYTCANGCQSSYTEDILNKGGHKYNDDDWVVVEKPTCTKEGLEQHLCTVCSTPETRAIATIDHIWDTEFTVDVKPTGTTEGWKSRHCLLNCGNKTDETSLGYCEHANINDEWHIETEVTCTTDGSQYQLCDDCGDKVNETVIPMLGHDYVDTAQISAADCLNGAVYSTACANCGDVATRTTEPNGHSDSIWFTTQDPTCTTDGTATKYCTECSETTATKAIPATAHAAGRVWTVITPATCTTSGLEAYACVDCAEYTETRTVAALGHQDVHTDDQPATCTEAGYRNYVCTVCGENHTTEIPATGHTAGEWEITKIATTLGTGERVKRCTTCGETVETEVLEQIVCSGNNFVDVAANAWYRSSVNFVYCSGLMNGTTATKFAPTASTTRGMFVTILGRLSGIDADKYTDVAYFEDVRDGSYYFGYIEWARQNGIVDGTGNFVFQPDRAITRQEMCKIIVSYADYEQVELENKNVKTTFTDDSDISGWAKSFVYEAQRAGIVSGDKVGTFRPKDTATRAEVATLIKNFCANYIY